MKSKPVVIGLCGAKQSGKTTTAHIIAEFIPSKEIAFADKLKDVCADVFGIERRYFDDQDLKEVPFEEPLVLQKKHCLEILMNYDVKPETVNFSSVLGIKMLTPRSIAQTIGTNFLRNLVDDNIHINSITLSNKYVSICPDVRFANEYTAFANRDDIHYYPAYIDRQEKERLIDETAHIAEREFLTFKHLFYRIDNNGSLKDLERNVKVFLDEVVKK